MLSPGSHPPMTMEIKGKSQQRHSCVSGNWGHPRQLPTHQQLLQCYYNSFNANLNNLDANFTNFTAKYNYKYNSFWAKDASRSAQYWTRQHITLGHTFRARQLAACAEDVMPPGTQLPLVWHQPSPLLTSRHLWDSNPRGKKRATLHDFTVIQNSDEPWFLLFPDLFRQFHGFFCLNIGHPIPSAKKNSFSQGQHVIFAVNLPWALSGPKHWSG